MKDGHTTHGESSFGKKLWCVLIVLFLGGIGWQVWKLHLYNNAVRQAKEAGFDWRCEDTLSLIRQDWHNALKKETWGKHERVLVMRGVSDLGRYREMLHQLNPTELRAWEYKDGNLDALKDLTALQKLSFFVCTKLKNVDGLKDLTALQTLSLDGCTALQNADALKGLTGLQRLSFTGCDALQNLDGIKGLTRLQGLGLAFCNELQNVDAIKGLTTLKQLNLGSCHALQNVDAIKGLTALKDLDLSYCTSLQSVDALRGLTALQRLDLSNCTALQNVDGLKGLTSLQTLYLYDCKKIPASALRELHAALPNTDISFPDGPNTPPQ